MTTSRLRGRIGLTLIACAMAAVAHAQDALVVDDLFLSAIRDPGARIGPAPLALQAPLAGGGRYAVGPTVAIDRVTGQTYPLPFTAFVLDVDPVRPRAFLAQLCDQTVNTCQVVTWNILTGVSVPLTTIAYTQPGGFFGLTWPLVRYAVDADVLFVDRAFNSLFLPGPRPGRSILPVNASTGAALGPPFTTRFASWDVWPDASLLIAGATLYPPPGEPMLAETIEVATQRVVARSTQRLENVTWVPSLQAIVSGNSGYLEAFDVNLVPVASATFGAGCSFGWQVSPHTGRIYVLASGGFNYIGSYPTHLFVIDPGTSFVDVDLSTKAGIPPGGCSTLRVLSPPGAPRAFQATVAAHDVSLQWQNVGAASHFVLDVGLAPGRTDLSIYLGPDSHTSFAGVPSGTYYLRLRGGNEFGGGRPSQEVTLVVP